MTCGPNCIEASVPSGPLCQWHVDPDVHLPLFLPVKCEMHLFFNPCQNLVTSFSLTYYLEICCFFFLKISKIIIHKTGVCIFIIFSWYKVWSSHKFNFKKCAHIDHNYTPQTTWIAKVMNTTFVQLMETNKCYFDTLAIFQKESKVVHKKYNLSYSSMNLEWDM
jgi:hypothetical protein